MKIDPHIPSPKFANPSRILRELQLQPGSIVADLGCGSGYYVFAAAPLVGEEGKIFAVDIQKIVLSALQGEIKHRGLRNVTTVWADVEIPGSTKIKDNLADLTLLTSILYQTKKHENILAEAKRITKNAGKIIIIDWSQANVPLGPHTKLRVAKDDIRKKAENVGLKFVREIEIDNYHYGMEFIK